MRKIEHIGIAVKDINASIEVYENLLGSSCYKTEIVESEFVKTAFFHIGESKIELLQATNEASAIARFLDKKGSGIHHIAFDVDNIDKEIERLEGLGFILINQTPKNGADNKRIAFLHPKLTEGVLVELCQERSE